MNVSGLDSASYAPSLLCLFLGLVVFEFGFLRYQFSLLGSRIFLFFIFPFLGLFEVFFFSCSSSSHFLMKFLVFLIISGAPCLFLENRLDVYIHDYLVKRDLKASAQAFQAEGKVSSDPVGKII